MTHISKTTKAQLAQSLAEAEEQLAFVRDERDRVSEKLRTLIIPTPRKVPEADALAGCIRALDGLPTTTRDGYNFGVTKDAPDRASVRRILVHLADQYGVTLIEKTTEPCSRSHLDELDMGYVESAIRSGVAR